MAILLACLYIPFQEIPTVLEKETDMKTLILTTLMMASSAFAKSSLSIEPSRASGIALQLGSLRTYRQVIHKDTIMSGESVYRGKYKAGSFGEYYVSATASSANPQKTVTCEGVIRIVRAPVIKHPAHEIVLERSDVTNFHLETYADMSGFACTESN